MIENISDIKSINILVYGDYMIDKYVVGKVERISPEAPVPILKVEKKESKLGGAGNLINNIIELGANVKAIGYVGNDDDGQLLLNELDKKNVNIDFMYKNIEEKTIVKTRVCTNSQQFIRFDEENISKISEENINILKREIHNIFEDCDILVISDYGKSENEEIVKILIDYANQNNIISIVDPKGKSYNKYNNATFCTPNIKELEDATNEKVKTDDDINRLCLRLCENFNIENIILTRSENGITVVNKNGVRKDFPVNKKEVIDVSGAGDTVVALLAIGQAMKMELNENCKLANVAASIVCSKFGTSTCTWNEILCNNISKKNVSLDELNLIVKKLKDEHKKIIFTNGCFDLLHVGHIDSLKQAKKMGDILIVAVNSDESIKRYKGEKRPIIDECSRLEIISSLDVVDYVVIMNDDNPINIINEIKPDVSVKGIDWKEKYIPEKELIESYGGKMNFIEFKNDISTTKIIKKISEINNE